jgi:mannose-6-phosphate isomerase-like protein (cupin superfamily)
MSSSTARAPRPAGATTATYGAALTFETLVAGERPRSRVQPSDDTLLRVIAGVVCVTVRGSERLLGPGDETVIPAGSRHTLESAGLEARLVSGLRPAGR